MLIVKLVVIPDKTQKNTENQNNILIKVSNFYTNKNTK